MDSPTDGTTIERGTGLTPTERYLGRIADACFLSLWSYPGVYRDQGDGPGKEICDLLVIFGDHVLIFSDKNVQYPDTGDEDRDWSRWYRTAVEESAKQVWGAERWLREHPDRVFLDSRCTQRFPLAIPLAGAAKVHRIVVAHDTSGRRRQLTGGSGSLLVVPDIVGPDHLLPVGQGGQPLAVGQVDPLKGYVHVLDEISLKLVLGNLDTASDFVTYLEKKERLIRSERLAGAYGEEDLLAFYLRHINADGVHDFVLPGDGSRVLVEEGIYANWVSSPEANAKWEADRPSFLWDQIIEEFAENIRHGTLHVGSHPSIERQENVLRVMASEPRVRRRMLARGMLEKLRDSPKDEVGVRLLGAGDAEYPWYVFVCVPPEWGASDADRREKRGAFLSSYCKVVKLEHPELQKIIGIATESGIGVDRRSHDVVMLDGDQWTEEDFDEARQIQAETGFMKKLRKLEGTELEYPVERYYGSQRKVGRNERCPCGSGHKFKRCCGSAV